MLEKQGKRSGVKAGQWQRALLGGGAECAERCLQMAHGCLQQAEAAGAR